MHSQKIAKGFSTQAGTDASSYGVCHPVKFEQLCEVISKASRGCVCRLTEERSLLQAMMERCDFGAPKLNADYAPSVPGADSEIRHSPNLGDIWSSREPTHLGAAGFEFFEHLESLTNAECEERLAKDIRSFGRSRVPPPPTR